MTSIERSKETSFGIWSALLQTLIEEDKGNRGPYLDYVKERKILWKELYGKSGEIDLDAETAQRMRRVLLSPFRRFPLEPEEKERDKAGLDFLTKADGPGPYSLAVLVALFHRPLHALPPLDCERLEPWLPSFLGGLVQNQAFISVTDDEAATLRAMEWLQVFARNMKETHRKGLLIGGEKAWREGWLPLLAMNIRALDFYSTNANMADFARAFGLLRQEFFAANPLPQEKEPIRLLGHLPPRAPGDKRPRIGLFCTNPVSHGHGLPHMLWWVACCDRSRFELVLVWQESSTNALLIDTLLSSFPRLPEMAPILLVPESSISKLKDFDIDILFNMQDLCWGLNERPAYTDIARVQVTGFYTPATTGATEIDYYVSSPDLDPCPKDAFTEKLIMREGLPFCIHYASYFGVEPFLTRAEVGLPEDAVIITMGSSMMTKVRLDFARTLARIMARVPDALCVCMVQVPQNYRPHLVNLFIRAFEEEGVDPGRMKLYSMTNRTLLHGMIRYSDLFLDFFPFSGTNNILDPLTLKTPCVTLCPPNAYSRNRVAGAILRSMGLEELVVETIDDYVDLAVRLCEDAAFRDAVRKKMGREAMERSLICDGEAFIRRMESVFDEILKREASSGRREVA